MPADILKAPSRQTRSAGCAAGLAAAGPQRTQTHCRAWRKDHTPWVHRHLRLPRVPIPSLPSLVAVVPGPWGALGTGVEVRAPALGVPLQETPHLVGQRLTDPSPQVAVLLQARVWARMWAAV